MDAVRAPAHLPGESARSARSNHSVMNTRVTDARHSACADSPEMALFKDYNEDFFFNPTTEKGLIYIMCLCVRVSIIYLIIIVLTG